ncbi:MAG: hypothetical protein EA341_15355 [Mongoliibacter sp.]|nr:MAG: hypothetical protein EA341_15355 [Mongoliibacter sp.]
MNRPSEAIPAAFFFLKHHNIKPKVNFKMLLNNSLYRNFYQANPLQKFKTWIGTKNHKLQIIIKVPLSTSIRERKI